MGMMMSHLEAQVGIGTSEPKAQLDIVATSTADPASIDGILIPRIMKFPVVVPSEDQHGMLVFLTKSVSGIPEGFYFWNATEKSGKRLLQKLIQQTSIKPVRRFLLIILQIPFFVKPAWVLVQIRLPQDCKSPSLQGKIPDSKKVLR